MRQHQGSGQALPSSPPTAVMLICSSSAEQSELKGHPILWPSLQQDCGCEPGFRDQQEEQLIRAASSNCLLFQHSILPPLHPLMPPDLQLQLCVPVLSPGERRAHLPCCWGPWTCAGQPSSPAACPGSCLLTSHLHLYGLKAPEPNLPIPMALAQTMQIAPGLEVT